MLTVDVLNLNGEKIKKLTLPREIFGGRINKVLMAQAVRVYLSNQRTGNAKAKRRGEINATGKKIYRQKGTGHARHGDRKAPIFVKGAKAHGPTGEQNYKLKISKTLKKQALFSALASKLKSQEIVVLEGLEKIKPKTKVLAKIMLKLKAESKKQTIVLSGNVENIIRAGRNLANLSLMRADSLNTYKVLNGGKLIFMPESIDLLKKHYGTKSSN